MSDALRQSKADPQTGLAPGKSLTVSYAALNRDAACVETPPRCGAQKLCPPRQATQRLPRRRLAGAGHRNLPDEAQAERRLRPRARRAAITFWPPLVAMRAR
jgi:hypothetical protein